MQKIISYIKKPNIDIYFVEERPIFSLDDNYYYISTYQLFRISEEIIENQYNSYSIGFYLNLN
jgi:hypothetical protein